MSDPADPTDPANPGDPLTPQSNKPVRPKGPEKKKKVRADVLLFERGLAPSRERARALILAGVVHTESRRVEKAGEKLAADTVLGVRGQDHPFVSRGGVKLAGALDAFEYDPRGKVAADIGASTGGFTDCLLQRGAEHVYAIDVGYGQLHEKLRQDVRVTNMERTNARVLVASDLPRPVALIVIDASFIGLDKLLPALVPLLQEEGDIIAMVKPQFQVGREHVGKGGVVRDPALRLKAIDDVAAAARALGLVERARADAPIRGPKGNHEAFLWLSRPPAPGADPESCSMT